MPLDPVQLPGLYPELASHYQSQGNHTHLSAENWTEPLFHFHNQALGHLSEVKGNAVSAGLHRADK